MINNKEYVDIKIPNHTIIDKPNKSGFILSRQSFYEISKQVFKGYKNANPIVLTEYNSLSAPNNFFKVDSQFIIGFMKEYKYDEITVCIQKDKVDKFNRLIDLGYEPCYRLSCKIDDDKVMHSINVLCFDMEKVKHNIIK